jgi:hypothetical protein
MIQRKKEEVKIKFEIQGIFTLPDPKGSASYCHYFWSIFCCLSIVVVNMSHILIISSALLGQNMKE